jgi:hypothetical protein
MKEFYTATTEVVNLEHLYLGTGKAHNDGFHEGTAANGVKYLDIYLKPVGKTIIPTNPQQLKLALLCILRCIKQLHSLGYFHTDIRWFNVVYYGISWFLIDCYDFCAATDHDRLVAIKRQRTGGSAEDVEWCARDDLLQVIMLAQAEQFLGDAYNMFDVVHALVDQVAAGLTSVDDIIEIVDHIAV